MEFFLHYTFPASEANQELYCTALETIKDGPKDDEKLAQALPAIDFNLKRLAKANAIRAFNLTAESQQCKYSL